MLGKINNFYNAFLYDAQSIKLKLITVKILYMGVYVCKYRIHLERGSVGVRNVVNIFLPSPFNWSYVILSENLLVNHSETLKQRITEKYCIYLRTATNIYNYYY